MEIHGNSVADDLDRSITPLVIGSLKTISLCLLSIVVIVVVWILPSEGKFCTAEYVVWILPDTQCSGFYQGRRLTVTTLSLSPGKIQGRSPALVKTRPGIIQSHGQLTCLVKTRAMCAW